jgi:predicted dehydrogenase
MSAVLRLGIVGCGRLAERGYVPAAAASASVEIAAVADPNEVRRERVAAATGARPHETVEEMLGAAAVEAVVVASPAEHHLEHARLVAASGLACLVEKPPAPDAAGARELAALGPAPWVGFNRRFDRLGRLRDAVPAEGPLELELELRYRRASWRPVMVRDDALADLGAHLTDIALFLSGGGAARVRSARLSAERAELELELARGRAVLRTATDSTHRERAVARRPGGEDLAATSTPGAVRGGLERLARREHPLVRSLRGQLNAFATAARGGDPGPLATAADGLRAMLLVDEARALAG